MDLYHASQRLHSDSPNEAPPLKTEELTEQLKFLESVIKSIPYPFFVINAQDFTVEYSNTHRGFDLKSVGITCFELTHGSSKPCYECGTVCPMKLIKETKRPTMVEHVHLDENGNARTYEVHGAPYFDPQGNVTKMIEFTIDITEKRKIEQELAGKVSQLEAALANVNQLEGIIPICMYCKKIRDDQESWHQLEKYITEHTDAHFSHGICPDCNRKAPWRE